MTSSQSQIKFWFGIPGEVKHYVKEIQYGETIYIRDTKSYSFALQCFEDANGQTGLKKDKSEEGEEREDE